MAVAEHIVPNCRDTSIEDGVKQVCLRVWKLVRIPMIKPRFAKFHTASIQIDLSRISLSKRNVDGELRQARFPPAG